MGFKAINDVVFGVENLAVIYLGALAVLDGRMTIGMLFAFIAYKQQFVDKAVRLIEKAIEFRMLDLHLERLADITQAEPEPGQDLTSYRPPPVGRIEVRNLSFRYGPSESFVFEHVNFVVEPGDYLAIIGPSGGGKTTLMKVMLGLLEPTDGEVLIDGLPLGTFGARAFRDHVGVVMQDDQLLSGSIADNICFFDHEFDHARMQHCAELACVHDDIMRMPMSYDSLIGDMGSSLSGGQRQRILLARALYRRPRLLFMDEGTSHLDTDDRGTGEHGDPRARPHAHHHCTPTGDDRLRFTPNLHHERSAAGGGAAGFRFATKCDLESDLCGRRSMWPKPWRDFVVVEFIIATTTEIDRERQKPGRQAANGVIVVPDRPSKTAMVTGRLSDQWLVSTY